ncbi:hypothetical protein ACFUTX_12120 [Microbacterium sp. NPDC057407]|uniref:hypothetical protein n=1 Tax=Microbacterium sp. NPDC057407 TaxID=3346120 RepID=UPI00366E8177
MLAIGLASRGCGAILAAIAAFAQAREAKKARAAAQAAGRETAVLAAEANRAWTRIADAEEIVAQSHRPKAWGPLKGGAGDLWVIRNTSERPIMLERIDVVPKEATPLFELDVELPKLFRAGEQLQFWARSRYALSIRTITLHWEFADENGPAHDSERTLIAG